MDVMDALTLRHKRRNEMSGAIAMDRKRLLRVALARHGNRGSGIRNRREGRIARDDCDNQRAACRQNSSWLRSVEAASMRQRQDASPPNTIERPLPYF